MAKGLILAGPQRNSKIVADEPCGLRERTIFKSFKGVQVV
jgi:hypothetical protein